MLCSLNLTVPMLVTGPPKCRREASTSTNLRFIPSGLQLHWNLIEVFCFSFEHKACKCCILFHDLLIFKNKNNVLNHFYQGERNFLLKAWICLPNTSIRKGKATREELQFHKGEPPPLVLRTTLPEMGEGIICLRIYGSWAGKAMVCEQIRH